MMNKLGKLIASLVLLSSSAIAIPLAEMDKDQGGNPNKPDSNTIFPDLIDPPPPPPPPERAS